MFWNWLQRKLGLTSQGLLLESIKSELVSIRLEQARLRKRAASRNPPPL